MKAEKQEVKSEGMDMQLNTAAGTWVKPGLLMLTHHSQPNPDSTVPYPDLLCPGSIDRGHGLCSLLQPENTALLSSQEGTTAASIYCADSLSQ